MRHFHRKKSLSAAHKMAVKGELKRKEAAYREAGQYYEKAINLLPEGKRH